MNPLLSAWIMQLNITDIGLHIGVSLSDAHKMELLNNSWVPGADYAMPYSTRIINGKEEKRYLKHTHLQQHSFLSYSPSQQGLFCRPCVLFGPTTGEAGRGHQKLNALVSKPLNKYHRLFGKDGYVTNHEATDYHKSAIIQAAEFRHRMKTGVDIWKKRWADKVDCPDTAIDALAVCDTDLFPNIGRLLQITATLPVTSASAERSFSVLKRLKTYLRTTMGEVR